MGARLAWALLTFIVYDVLSFVLLIVPGYFIVPVAILFRVMEMSPITQGGPPIVNAPFLLWLWGNDEDGYEPEWYVKATPTWNRYVRMWVWAAWRNAANNLRFVKALHPPPVVGEVQAITRYRSWGRVELVWQGLFCRLNIYTPKWEFRIGWKYELWDATQPCTDWRRFGCGFGTRFIRY